MPFGNQTELQSHLGSMFLLDCYAGLLRLLSKNPFLDLIREFPPSAGAARPGMMWERRVAAPSATLGPPSAACAAAMQAIAPAGSSAAVIAG